MESKALLVIYKTSVSPSAETGHNSQLTTWKKGVRDKFRKHPVISGLTP
jgi:hypothetical protein